MYTGTEGESLDAYTAGVMKRVKESVPTEWHGAILGPCMHGAEEAEVVRENDIVEHDAEDDVVKYDAEITYEGTIHRD